MFTVSRCCFCFGSTLMQCLTVALVMSRYFGYTGVIHIRCYHTIAYFRNGSFHFWISLSPRLSLSPKFGLRPKISQKVKSFFVWTRRIAQRVAKRFSESNVRTGRSYSKLINSPVDFACTRYVG